MEDPTLSTNETNDEKYGAQLEAVTSIHHSAIVMGIVNSTGRPLTARLLPRYRDQMQRCRRTEQAAKEANPTSSQQPATVSGTFRGLSATCDKPYGKENATIDDDGRLVIRTYHRRSTTNNIQSCRFDSKPLLHQELECKIASTTGPLQEINALTEVSRCLHSDKWTQNDVHQPPTASPTAATSESDVVSSDCILVNNQRNENVSKSSARCHWRRLNGLVWSLERSDNTINRWNSVKHGVRDSRVMRQSNCSDDTKTSHGGHSSFELALMNGDSSPADRQVDAKLLEAIRMDEFEPNDSLGRHVDSNADSKADDVAVATRRQLRREQCVNCCRKFMAFLFSTVGSSFVLVGYVIMGGLTFRALEAENELNTKIDMQKVRLEHIHWLWNVTEEMNVLHPDAWCIEAERILASFSTRVTLKFCIGFAKYEILLAVLKKKTRFHVFVTTIFLIFLLYLVCFQHRFIQPQRFMAGTERMATANNSGLTRGRYSIQSLS
jgi:hypothetical protein